MVSLTYRARMPPQFHVVTDTVMQIQVNGEPYQLPDAQSVADLLQRLELTGRRVAVELNMEIVPRSQHATTLLAEGDQVEVVHAIGGG